MDKKRHSKDKFKVIHKKCGHGHAKVSLVKRKSDGKLLIWKRPKSHSQRHYESLRKQIKKSKYWRKFGISKVKVYWHPDKQSLLKTYIRGKTLTQILKKNPEFFSEKENKPVKALIKFLGLLIDSKHYFHDLKGSNLVFDGNRWQVIDSGPANDKKTQSATSQEYRKNLLEKWSRRLRSKEINSLKSFLEKYCC